MSIYCDSSYEYDGDFDWYWIGPNAEAPLDTKRSRKCCPCGDRIAVGDVSRKVRRFRGPGNDTEDRIYGDEVPLANWYLCERCGDLADSLKELGYCYSLGGQSLKSQIAEYRAEGGIL